jgi:hypothetical protein
MARVQRPKFKTDPTNQTWFLPKAIEGEWYPVVRVGRHVPFGYEQDPDDDMILLPIQSELELLEKAKKYLAEYSLRLVAQWLSQESGRYISHVGLIKRVNIEKTRNQAADAHRVYARRCKEASEKALKLEEQRIGGRRTRAGSDEEDSSSSGSTS